MKKTVRWLQVSAAVLFVVLLIAALVINRMWQDRADIADIGWPQADTTANPDARVFVTWLGITTLLFDDGETQILIDGTITRVSALDLIFSLPISSDVAAINYALSTFRVNRLAAIIPVHSHFDHAMDLGHIANRTTAVVLGSESTANIARGAGVPVDQYQTLDNGESRQFGEFTIRLVASVHAPVGLNGEEWFPGRISLPLRQPENPSAWKTGVAWSIFIEHPRGTSLIQGSAGFVAGSMVDESADVVMLGVGGLAGLDAEYASDYWNEIVVATGASRVLSVHHDDYTAPFGEIRLFPNIADNVLQAAKWLDAANSAGEKEVVIELPPFGQMIPLY
jgi:L-ascorbate metabolism protein UlaG (beta-lactamase superfamily)